jgi:hypothetical protein
VSSGLRNNEKKRTIIIVIIIAAAITFSIGFYTASPFFGIILIV